MPVYNDPFPFGDRWNASALSRMAAAADRSGGGEEDRLGNGQRDKPRRCGPPSLAPPTAVMTAAAHSPAQAARRFDGLSDRLAAAS